MGNHCSMAKSWLLLLARLCISLIFVFAGVHKITHFTEVAAGMASMGVPESQLMLVVAIIFELGGGLMVLLGWYARFGAFLLFLFIIPVTYVFHSFWDYQGTEMVNNMHHMMKNISMLGGLLYVLGFGAGHISFDSCFRKKCCQKKE